LAVEIETKIEFGKLRKVEKVEKDLEEFGTAPFSTLSTS
jgi:hypothetical protein